VELKKVMEGNMRVKFGFGFVLAVFSVLVTDCVKHISPAAALNPEVLSSPDLILYADSGYSTNGTREICTMKPDGSSKKRVTTNTAEESCQVLSPDMTKIAFCANLEGTDDIYVINADGTGLLRITNSTETEAGVMWSADNSKLLFERHNVGTAGNTEIFTVNANGTGELNLTNNSVLDQHPCWSADGQKIAYVTYTGANETQVFVMNADGSNKTQITTGAHEKFSPVWSPDGSMILYYSVGTNACFDAFTVNVATHVQVNLTNLSAASSGVFYPVWSPDGTKIMYALTDSNPSGEIFVMNADGSGSVKVADYADGSIHAGWSPDSTGIVFYRNIGGNSKVCKMKADGSEKTELTDGISNCVAFGWY